MASHASSASLASKPPVAAASEAKPIHGGGGDGVPGKANTAISGTCPCRRRVATTTVSPAATKPQHHHRHPSSDRLCASCVQAYLQQARQRRERVRLEHARWQSQCQAALDASPQSAEQWQRELLDWHEQSEKLRLQMNQLAFSTAQLAVHNNQRRSALEHAQASLSHHSTALHRWQTATASALSRATHDAQRATCRLRFHWAVAAFDLHRLDVIEPPRLTPRTKHARGIGKIGGLPLPHAGPELYGVLPPTELQSALRLVASLTSLVATCLGISLPHPILLHVPPSAVAVRTVDLAQQAKLAEKETAVVDPDGVVPGVFHQPSSSEAFVKSSEPTTTSLSASTASLASYLGNTAKSVLSRNAPAAASTILSALAQSPTTQSSPTPPLRPTSPAAAAALESPKPASATVQQRIHHATCAVVAEKQADDTTAVPAAAATYSLSVACQQHQPDEYAIALQFLQNDIVALCMRAGAPVAQLWPAEAVLLNLHVLHEYCQEQAAASTDAEDGTP